MLNSIQIKRRLAEGGHFTDEQAEHLAEELATLAESNLVTTDELDKKLSRWAVRIIVANLAGTAALHALYGFAV